MKTLLNEWNNIMQKPAPDDITLRRLDGYNKTRYSRRKNQEGLLEVASREAYENRKTHFATILLDDDTPYCAIESNTGYFGVDFLREELDCYLLYDYRDSYSQDGRLFLNTIMLSGCEAGTDRIVSRIDWYFTPEGQCRSRTFQGDWVEGTYQEIIDELPPLSEQELFKLWAPYPPFKEYDELIRLDRIPQVVLQSILDYTDQWFPIFRQHLQRDIDQNTP